MELMTSWERKGRQEGRVEGQLEIVQRLLERQVGPLAPSTLKRIRQLSGPQLTALAEAERDFQGVADVRAWLARQH